MASVTVLQLSDTHFTEAGDRTVKGHDPAVRLDRVLGAWEASGVRADLVVLTGDNADDGSIGACRRLAAALRTLGAPVLAVSGNHDVAAKVEAVFGRPEAIEVGAWRVVGVASERPGRTEGTVDVAECLARLDRLDDRPTVIAVHHPPVSVSTHPWFQLEGASDLLSGLGRRPHVRAVISGHLHEAFQRTGDGRLELLGAPSTLYGLHHRGDDWTEAGDGATGARVLRLFDDGSMTSSVLTA